MHQRIFCGKRDASLLLQGPILFFRAAKVQQQPDRDARVHDMEIILILNRVCYAYINIFIRIHSITHPDVETLEMSINIDDDF